MYLKILRTQLQNWWREIRVKLMTIILKLRKQLMNDSMENKI